MSDNKARPTMVDMEKRLLEDKSGDYRRKVIDQLSSYKTWLQQKMNSGLNSGDFDAYGKLQVALNQAEDCIRNF